MGAAAQVYIGSLLTFAPPADVYAIYGSGFLLVFSSSGGFDVSSCHRSEPHRTVGKMGLNTHLIGLAMNLVGKSPTTGREKFWARPSGEARSPSSRCWERSSDNWVGAPRPSRAARGGIASLSASTHHTATVGYIRPLGIKHTHQWNYAATEHHLDIVGVRPLVEERCLVRVTRMRAVAEPSYALGKSTYRAMAR